ncbi:MAG TPA: dTDP-4-dehydrorhamnose 3,5-epimerase [Kiritimatiellia bacterium]|nr:dTDP-4-dehydrorhamnose 3,5-epimerase [Kiritimatiellia bacterium]HMO98065.1 dTDP-4-dehydrorhamnose 3,5-epimerase [Kiritimatiellia bacterium]HMP97011.1 dTDP-4-dehydrorhamnose 3,5-epimerase [Kiritimatiellia bacterium]
MSGVPHVPGKLPGVVLFQPKAFPDARGFFTETYHAEKYREAGVELPFLQDNFSYSRRHVLRGLHFQLRHPQGKLVCVISGEIYDVAVDIRRGSPTFGQWEAYVLSGDNHHQLYVPPGFAHGFVVLSEAAAVLYKCTDVYVPHDDVGFAWNDPDIGVEWPVDAPVLSDKDALLPRLRDVGDDRLPTYAGP